VVDKLCPGYKHKVKVLRGAGGPVPGEARARACKCRCCSYRPAEAKWFAPTKSPTAPAPASLCNKARFASRAAPLTPGFLPAALQVDVGAPSNGTYNCIGLTSTLGEFTRSEQCVGRAVRSNSSPGVHGPGAPRQPAGVRAAV
jgi:hypothetical protein